MAVAIWEGSRALGVELDVPLRARAAEGDGRALRGEPAGRDGSDRARGGGAERAVQGLRAEPLQGDSPRVAETEIAREIERDRPRSNEIETRPPEIERDRPRCPR